MAGKAGGLLDGALPDLVLEMGYHFTSSVEECRASLLQLGGTEVYAATVAKVRSNESILLPLCAFSFLRKHRLVTVTSIKYRKYL